MLESGRSSAVCQMCLRHRDVNILCTVWLLLNIVQFTNLNTLELRQNVKWLDKCCDWLQQLCLKNIPTWAAKITLFHFRRGL